MNDYKVVVPFKFKKKFNFLKKFKKIILGLGLNFTWDIY